MFNTGSGYGSLKFTSSHISNPFLFHMKQLKAARPCWAGGLRKVADGRRGYTSAIYMRIAFSVGSSV